jgi:hypothetical protein
MLSSICSGQYQNDVPLGAMPMQYNSSFAGQAGSPRVSSNLQYLQHRVFFRTTLFKAVASYDQFIPAIRSGVGITVGYNAGQTTIGSGLSGLSFDKATSDGTSVTIAFAPKISLKGKYTISPSIDFTYAATEINRTLNQIPVIDNRDDIIGQQQGINSNAGILFNTNKLYIGYSMSILRRTIGDSQYNPANIRQRSWFYSNLQAGYTFQKNSESKFSFTPQIVVYLVKYNYSPRISIGLQAFNANFRYKQFIWGVNDGGVYYYTRGNYKRQLTEMGGVHIGWQTDKFRVMFTNSYSRKRTYEEFDYRGNLSFRYILGSKDQKSGRGW